MEGMERMAGVCIVQGCVLTAGDRISLFQAPKSRKVEYVKGIFMKSASRGIVTSSSRMECCSSAINKKNIETWCHSIPYLHRQYVIVYFCYSQAYLFSSLTHYQQMQGPTELDRVRVYQYQIRVCLEVQKPFRVIMKCQLWGNQHQKSQLLQLVQV